MSKGGRDIGAAQLTNLNVMQSLDHGIYHQQGGAFATGYIINVICRGYE